MNTVLIIVTLVEVGLASPAAASQLHKVGFFRPVNISRAVVCLVSPFH